jgi:hypothetical protein
MDRQIVYPASIPLDTDILGAQRDAMIALGYLLQATLGTGTVADGLACTPTSPASLTVNVGPGSITQLTVIDSTDYGSLPASSNPLMKLGINVGTTQFTLTPPANTGQSINYLIEASFQETDANAVVLPYYNAANPAQPYSGPDNSGATQNTQRVQSVSLQIKSGPPGPSGSQSTPSVDQGYVGLWVITLSYGVTAITSANIAPYPTAPFIAYKLPKLTPGTHNIQAFGPTTQGGWLVPAGVSSVKVRLWGGGGAGGAGFTAAGGGGAGGGYSEGFYGVTPGEVIAISVGNGGAGSGSGGGTSSFGALASASGGQAGNDGSPGTGGTGGVAGGTGAGSGYTISGSSGAPAAGAGTVWFSGAGGSAFGGAGALSVVGYSGSANFNGNNGAIPGAGGSGGIGTGIGGNGGPGLVLVEW